MSSAGYLGALPDKDWYTRVQTRKFECHSLMDRKPVQLTQDRYNVVATFCSSDEARGGFLN